MPFGRPRKNIVGFAARDQYTCRMTSVDPESGREYLCGDKVPEGELTTNAHNARNGQVYVLCAKHRQAFRELLDAFAPAAIGTEVVTAVRSELADGGLVSHSRLREALMERGLAAPKGPLSDEQLREGVKLLRGDDAQIIRSYQ